MRHGLRDPYRSRHHGRAQHPRTPMLTPGIITEALRWLFWGLLYLMTLTIGFIAFLHVPTTMEVRWLLLAVVALGIVVDVLHKLRADAQRA